MSFVFSRAYIYTTTSCQFRCKHCFVREERKKFKPKHIELDLVEQFIHDFGNAKYAGFKETNITGVGNPLLYPHLKELIELLRTATERELSINCRGEIKDDLLHTFKVHRVSVYYSMDFWGTKADEQMRFDGLWEQQWKTLNKMLSMKIPIRIRTTIMKNNIADCLRLILLVEELRAKGVDIEWHGMPYLPYVSDELMPTQRQMEMLTSIVLSKDGMRIMHPFWTCIYPPFRDRAKRWWGKERICEAGRVGGRICLTQDGEVLPCPFETEVLVKYEKSGGEWKINWSLFKQNLKEYLSTSIPEYCNDCLFKDICKGGCRIHQRLSDKCICPIELW
ncbi:hypothetical protein DRO97_08145 [Archaeoglobales archaeon]|nr:MAG: hypothetical protein DRO97_08145 [Archaeoglobales archaeon]